MRRLAAVILAVGTILIALAWPLIDARSQDNTSTTIFELLTLEDATIGDFLEGDTPIERLAPFQLPEAPVALMQDEIAVPQGLSIDFSSYATPEQINVFLRELAAEYPDLVEIYELGTSWQGREILGARVANAAVPGSPIDARPAMYTDGQHHARELISKETVLYTLWWLVANHGVDDLATYLVDTRASYFVPSVNVDGNDIVLRDNQNWRKTANPECCDDDGDGSFDEDPPIGYGYGSFTLVRYTFTDRWMEQHPDDPFVAGWWRNLQRPAEQLGFYSGTPGGEVEEIPAIDADGDGRVWEDPIGGVDANRNYDWLWDSGDARVTSETFRGPEVFSEPSTRAVRDFVGGLPHLATAISYHSGIDLILFPWGHSREETLPDAELYERLGRKGSQLTAVHGIPGSPHVWTARGLYSAFGSTMDWLYGKHGVYAFSPEVYGGSGTLHAERTGTLTFTVASSVGASFNPPPQEMLPWLDRWNRFAVYLLAATPNIELNDVSTDASITIGNDGFLPVDVELALVSDNGVALAIDQAERLMHGTHTWSPFGDYPPATGTASLVVTATLASGTVPHVVETARWTLSFTPNGVTVSDGRIVPFRDLSRAFGGWQAGPEWGGPDYTCGPGGCSNIRLPEDPIPTETAVPSTPTATPVPTALPAGLLLPRLLRDS